MWKLLTAVLACLLFSAPLAAESLGTLKKGKFATQAMVAEGTAPELKIEGIGTFKLMEIEPGKGGGNCHVSLESLQKLIGRGHRDGTIRLQPTAAITVKMETGECTDPTGKRVLCCLGPGSTCSVTVQPSSLY